MGWIVELLVQKYAVQCGKGQETRGIISCYENAVICFFFCFSCSNTAHKALWSYGSSEDSLRILPAALIYHDLGTTKVWETTKRCGHVPEWLLSA